MVTVDGAAALLFRRAYGFIGEIKLVPPDDSTIVWCEASSLLQIIVKMRRSYGGDPAERRDGLIYCRVRDFPIDACFDDPRALFRDVAPVTGFIGATSGEHGTAQLAGRGPVPSAEWQLRLPHSFMGEGIDVGGDAIAVVPPLSKANFLRLHFPNAPYDRPPGPLAPKYLDPYDGSFRDPAAMRIVAG